MQKTFIVFCTLLFSATLFYACRPARKVQKIETAINNVDTTHVTVIKPEEKTVDSLHVVKDIIKNLEDKRIDYKTFSAKVKFDYQGANDENHATANIHMKKDSIIWIQITGLAGIEGLRLIITKDSVKLINYLEHYYQFNTVSYLQDLVDAPLSFYNLQDIIVGNPIYVDSNVVSYKSAPNGLQVLMVGRMFKNLVTFDKANLHVIHSKLDDTDPLRNRTCDFTYNNYKTQDTLSFSTSREITFAEKSKLDISLEFKQYNFNQPETYPFNIPKRYKRKP